MMSNSNADPSAAQRTEVAVACDLCGADDTTILHPAGEAQRNAVVRCRQCGLMYANPRRFDVDHEEYEQVDELGVLEGVESDLTHPYRWRYDKERGQTRDVDRARSIVNTAHPDRGDLLEIGSSMGLLLEEFRSDGWTVRGVDPWKEAATYARSRGLECSASTLEDAGFESDSFDVVVMLHVIEHVPSPRTTLDEIWRVLRPGGHVILETPRYDTLMYRLLGRRERSLSCDGHIYFFESSTLRRLCTEIGCDVIDTEFNGRTLNAARLMWNLGVMSKSDRVASAVAGISERARLERVRFRLNVRDMQRLVLAKPF